MISFPQETALVPVSSWQTVLPHSLTALPWNAGGTNSNKREFPPQPGLKLKGWARDFYGSNCLWLSRVFSKGDRNSMIQLSLPLNLACPSLAGSCSSWWPLTPPHSQLQLQWLSSRSRESNAIFFPYSEPSTHILEPTACWPPHPRTAKPHLPASPPLTPLSPLLLSSSSQSVSSIFPP